MSPSSSSRSTPLRGRSSPVPVGGVELGSASPRASAAVSTALVVSLTYGSLVLRGPWGPQDHRLLRGWRFGCWRWPGRGASAAAAAPPAAGAGVPGFGLTGRGPVGPPSPPSLRSDGPPSSPLRLP